MSPTTKRESIDPLAIIQIEDRELMGAYIIYSPNASDEELETMWILAEDRDIVPLESVR